MRQHPDTPDQTPELPANAQHIPALDGLRGVAILLVLIHMLSLLDTAHGMPAYVFSRISQIGWTGVQLFFVLSGFLITGILLDTQRSGNYFSGFYARRALRIFPLYFITLTVAFVILPAINIEPPAIARDQSHQIWLWTWLVNWAGHFNAGSEAFPHFWSLAVEEQFYLVWPLLLRSRSPERCVRLCLALAAASLVLRCVLIGVGVSTELIYYNSFCRMDALTLGGAAAAALRVPQWRTQLLTMHNRYLLWSTLLGFAGLLITRGFWTGTVAGASIGYTIVALMFALLTLAIVGADASGSSTWIRLFQPRLLRATGKYSYAMYIIHKPLHDYVGKPLLAALNIDASGSLSWNCAYIVAGSISTLAIAILSWHLIEKWFLRQKHFFAPR